MTCASIVCGYPSSGQSWLALQVWRNRARPQRLPRRLTSAVGSPNCSQINGRLLNLEGLDVYNSNNGDKIGDISDLISMTAASSRRW